MNLEFDLGDAVTLLPLNLPGTVIEAKISIKGAQYLVRYFFNSVVQEIYMYPNELKLIPESTSGEHK